MPIFGLHRPHPVLAPVRAISWTAENLQDLSQYSPDSYLSSITSGYDRLRGSGGLACVLPAVPGSPDLAACRPASHSGHWPTPVPALPLSSKSEDGNPTEQMVYFLAYWHVNSWYSVTIPWLWSPVTSLHSTQNFPDTFVYGNCSCHRTLTPNRISR